MGGLIWGWSLSEATVEESCDGILGNFEKKLKTEFEKALNY
jgi:hypothetical protein